jgi:hypothetical protein
VFHPFEAGKMNSAPAEEKGDITTSYIAAGKKNKA